MKTKTFLTSLALAVGALAAGAALYPNPAEVPAAAMSSPRSAAQQADLGLALVQRARDEADPAFLVEAESALRASLELQPESNAPASVGMASLANFRHDFSGSLHWSRRAIAANPHGAAAYGLLGDALFELGRVRAAAAAYQQMVDLRPDTASYVRASYTLQDAGEMDAAIRTMRLALQAAGPIGESAAFVQHQLGDIFQSQGRYAQAERANRIGMQLAPGFVPPTVGVAEAYLARGDAQRAIPILERAVAELPTIEYMTTLGDVYRSLGRDKEARAMYTRVADSLAVYRDNGVKPDADFIIFYADHGVRPQAALREAFDIYENRPTGKVADALAWMLHALGRDREAHRYAREAVAAASASSAELFHAGQIERALGNRTAGNRLLRKALRMDPAFSVLDAAKARQLLAVDR